MDPNAAEIDITSLWARFVRVSQAVLAAVEADLKAAGFPPAMRAVSPAPRTAGGR
jgi:hypothetical protein